MSYLSILSSNRIKWLIVLVIIGITFGYYINRITINPPGFYVDEACIAYNGYLIGTTGVAENGDSFPLYIQCYTEGYAQWANPTHVYLLSLLYLIVPPSNLSARLLGATTMFLAALLLGLLARRLSGKISVGVIVALTGIFTPWLFEISRLVFESSSYPLIVVLFLFAVHNGFRRGKWTNLDCLFIALTLSLITYSYTIGRLLGPVLGLGLLLFATSWRQFWNVVKVGIIYSLTLIPFLVLFLSGAPAISERFQRNTILDGNKSTYQNFIEVAKAYFTDLSPDFLLLVGDPHQRHHLRADMGEIMVGTFALAILSVVLIFVLHRRNPWWRFVIFGALMSIIPGALTTQRHHALRLIAFPVFFIILLVPALQWLLEKGTRREGADPLPVLVRLRSEFVLRRTFLFLLLAITALQAIMFQVTYQRIGTSRTHDFETAYPSVLERALSESQRPIYLKDSYWGPTSIHAFWYAATHGLDKTELHRLLDNEIPPLGSIVLSSEKECGSGCERIFQEGVFFLYKTVATTQITSLPKPAISDSTGEALLSPMQFSSSGTGTGQMMKPMRLALDREGNVYASDTGNSRLQKFSIDGQFLLAFGQKGEGVGDLSEPHGVAIDDDGNIFVVDAALNKLVRFNKDGTFSKEWAGPLVGLYGPRDVAIGPNSSLYIVDQGNTRIVVFDPATEKIISWGSPGAGPGQFSDPTGIAIAPDRIFVADKGNKRVQVLDLQGKFVDAWPVPNWDNEHYHFPDLVYDTVSKILYLTNGSKNELITFDNAGSLLGRSALESETVAPVSLAIGAASNRRYLFVLDSARSSITRFQLVSEKQEPVKKRK